MPPSVPLSTTTAALGAAKPSTAGNTRPAARVVKSLNNSAGPRRVVQRATKQQQQQQQQPRRSRGAHNSPGTVQGLSTDDMATGNPSAAEDTTTFLTNQTSSLYSTPPPFSSYGMMGASMPYYGGGMVGPFSGLHQVLFGVQNVIFSLTQAVQLMGTNQQALQLALDSITKMVDAAIATFYELRALEAQKEYTPEQQRRRKRLRALRWALVMGGSWLVYKIIRMLTTSKRKRLTNYPHSPQSYYGGSMPYQQPTYGGGYGFMGGSSNFGGGHGPFGGGGGAGYV